jgi:hypothetical protein
MRYELADYEWTATRPMLPNKLRGVPWGERPTRCGRSWLDRLQKRKLIRPSGAFSPVAHRAIRRQRCTIACAKNRISPGDSTLIPLSSPSAKNILLPFFRSI